MKQLEHVASNLDTQSAEDEARHEVNRVKVAELGRSRVPESDGRDDILGALDLGMIFGGRL